jgi:hypothetical protein
MNVMKIMMHYAYMYSHKQMLLTVRSLLRYTMLDEGGGMEIMDLLRSTTVYRNIFICNMVMELA